MGVAPFIINGAIVVLEVCIVTAYAFLAFVYDGAALLQRLRRVLEKGKGRERKDGREGNERWIKEE